MFQNWGFLLGEIWVLLLLAALLGLFCGWLIWGRCCRELKRLRNGGQGSNGSSKGAKAGVAAAGAAGAATAAAGSKASKADDDAARASGLYDYDGDGKIEGRNEGTRPEAMKGPRGGKADNLKEIKGIGPKLEKLCHSLGIYHFDQIAAWGKNEIAWMDSNLEGFYGRVTRDEWVPQAKILAKGGETEFSKRVEGGKVY